MNLKGIEGSWEKSERGSDNYVNKIFMFDFLKNGFKVKIMGTIRNIHSKTKKKTLHISSP